ncbi:hypothetical protein LDENG_00060860 [Lucifuga dentata]|nr:hypothetical protein LDENG_00060860 [Lucifuga dentata]
MKSRSFKFFDKRRSSFGTIFPGGDIHCAETLKLHNFKKNSNINVSSINKLILIVYQNELKPMAVSNVGKKCFNSPFQ